MQVDDQELLQACTSEQWDVAVLIKSLEAQDKVVVYVCPDKTAQKGCTRQMYSYIANAFSLQFTIVVVVIPLTLTIIGYYLLEVFIKLWIFSVARISTLAWNYHRKLESKLY